MSDEIEIGSRNTAWVRGANTKMGTAILTDRRLLFFDKKFQAGGAGGALGALVGGALQKRHEDGGPMLTIDLADITGIGRIKKMMSKDRIVLRTAADEYVFSDGWKDFSPLLREALTETHGRRITELGAGDWTVS